MKYVRWVGLVACSLAALGFLVQGSYDMAGVMLALAALSLSNIRRKRAEPREPGQP